jgi:hypothetical protein
MSDSLEPNVSAPPAKPRAKRAPGTSKSRAKPQRAALPDWAPWAVLGGLIVVGAVGSSVVRAAVGSSKAHGEEAAPATSAPSVPTPAPKTAPSAGATATASAKAPKDDEPRISVQHLVVTHADSIMGKSLKIMRTREQAKQRAGEALARARKGEDFVKLINEYSEEPGTKETRGELKNFTRGDAISAFGDAAFKLKVGEISDLVDTPFGYMVIKRTD